MGPLSELFLNVDRKDKEALQLILVPTLSESRTSKGRYPMGNCRVPRKQSRQGRRAKRDRDPTRSDDDIAGCSRGFILGLIVLVDGRDKNARVQIGTCDRRSLNPLLLLVLVFLQPV